MRRLLTIAVIVLALTLCAWQPPDEYHADSSGELTADALIESQAGYLFAILITTDGSNAATITAYDNTEASGDKIVNDLVATTSSTNRGWVFSADPPVLFDNGLYIDVTCAGTVKYTVFYRRR